MLCYRCGSHVPESTDTCATCGQKLGTGGVRQATGSFSHKRLSHGSVLGAPYKTGDLIAQRYTVKDVIGSGPLGFVLRVKDNETDGDVAIKLIHPRFLQTPEERRLFSERMSAVRGLTHSNLARVYDEGEDQGWPFLATQYLDGLTLRKIIELRTEKGQLFTLRELEPIFSQIATALEAAQGLGPHADLKPENVLVLPDLLKVSDFGLGLAMPRVPFVQALKLRRADRYVAPEYASGAEIDERADVYSLGVILGEMVSGQTPDGSIPELSARNPALPHRIEGLYRKALNPDPAARFSSARELLHELSELLDASALDATASRAEAVAPPLVESSPGQAAGGQRRQTPPPVRAAALLANVEPLETEEPPPEDPTEATQPMTLEESGLLAPEAPGAAGSLGAGVAMGSLQRHSTSSPWWTPQVRAIAWVLILCVAGLVIGSAGGYWFAHRGRPASAQEGASLLESGPASSSPERPEAAASRRSP